MQTQRAPSSKSNSQAAKSQTLSDEPLRALKSDTHLFKRLSRYVLAHKGLFGLSLILYPLDAISIAIPPYLVQQILDTAIPQHDMKRLQMLALIYIGALLLEYFSGFAASMAMSVLGQRAMVSLRRELFAHVQKLPPSYFTRHPIGRILTRLTNDVEALGDVFATGAVTIITDILTVIAVIGMMLWLDVRLTLFAFLVVPPLVLLAFGFQRYARHAFRAIRTHLAGINAFLSEHVLSMSIVQIFRQEQRTQREFEDLNIAFRDANRRAIFFDAALFSVVEAIGTMAVAAMIWYGAIDMATGAVGAGTLVAFIQYIRRFFIPIRDLSQKYTILQSGFASAERSFELLDEPLELTSTEAKSAEPLHLQDRISLSHVWFSYQDEPQSDNDWVLRDISLTIKKGEKVALVGATGSGKTTLLKLLNRFYDVKRGSISIDHHDIRDIPLHQLRRLFAVVPQDVYLFSGTLMRNLTLDKIQPQAAERAMAAVSGDALISKLSAGFDTQVLELGSNFSAGERQLLAMARALAFDPEVLVLDEATSNIDSETEARIQKALEVLLRGRTALVVAHRLATVRQMDRIVVLQRGEIVEEGSHDVLMHRGGLYSNLVELQLSQPQEPV